MRGESDVGWETWGWGGRQEGGSREMLPTHQAKLITQDT